MIVVDTNIIGYLYLSSERSEQAEKALLKDAQWVAPILWRSEFRNVLALYMRKGVFLLEDAIRIMGEATLLMQDGEYEAVSLQVLQLANESKCSAYDCEFVALARDLEVRLVTVDKQLLKQFPNEAVSLDEFVG
ncbi:MAG: type II toxin-antitoxin system VapC family toxin [Chloroflexi bacterium]|nr:type II toxin-antitoxin system VapC family toxin [Chloroflexota bacterium]